LIFIPISVLTAFPTQVKTMLHHSFTRSLACIASAAFLSIGSARAAVIIKFDQIGLDVVASYSGSLDLSGYRVRGQVVATPQSNITPSSGGFGKMQRSYTNWRIYYYSTIAMPFGTVSTKISATSSSGQDFRIVGNNIDISGQSSCVYSDFCSGLDGRMTFSGMTFASMGITPRSTIVASLPNDTITFVVADVPAPATLPLMLGGLGVLAGVARRRSKRVTHAAI
jgi:hypothetical protein